MKKVYESPHIDITVFDIIDVISTSVPETEFPTEANETGPEWFEEWM